LWLEIHKNSCTGVGRKLTIADPKGLIAYVLLSPKCPIIYRFSKDGAKAHG
jgi:hypothetical protein